MASHTYISAPEPRTSGPTEVASRPSFEILIQSLPPTLNLHELAGLLHRSPATVLSDRTRAPHRVPPAVDIPGARGLLWITSTVVEWMAHPPANVRVLRRRPGRPLKTKVDARHPR